MGQLTMTFISMQLTSWVSIENEHYFCSFSWINYHHKDHHNLSVCALYPTIHRGKYNYNEAGLSFVG